MLFFVISPEVVRLAEMVVFLNRIFCPKCGMVFYAPRPPACFAGEAPQPKQCPYCSSSEILPFEVTRTVVQKPLPERAT